VVIEKKVEDILAEVKQEKWKENHKLCLKLVSQFEKKHPLKCWKCKVVVPLLYQKQQECSLCGRMNEKTQLVHYCPEHSRPNCDNRKCDYKQYLKKKIEVLEDKLGELGFLHQGEGVFQYVDEDTSKTDCCLIKETIFGKGEFKIENFSRPDLVNDWEKTWLSLVNNEAVVSCEECSNYSYGLVSNMEYKRHFFKWKLEQKRKRDKEKMGIGDNTNNKI